MAVTHRKDSIIGIKKEKADKQKGFMAVGKQIAKITVDVNEKEKIIETLGKQFAMQMLEISRLKKEIAELKGGK